jgi:hypothetical protein
VYDISPPWPNEVWSGRTGFDHRTHEAISTPIYDDLCRGDAPNWGNESAFVANHILASNPASSGSTAEPHTSPIPIQRPMDVPWLAELPLEPVSPLDQPRYPEPMSAFARERAAVAGMLAALRLRLTSPAAASTAASAAPGPAPYRGATPRPNIPRPSPPPSNAWNQSPVRGWPAISAR